MSVIITNCGHVCDVYVNKMLRLQSDIFRRHRRLVRGAINCYTVVEWWLQACPPFCTGKYPPLVLCKETVKEAKDPLAHDDPSNSASLVPVSVWLVSAYTGSRTFRVHTGVRHVWCLRLVAVHTSDQISLHKEIKLILWPACQRILCIPFLRHGHFVR